MSGHNSTYSLAVLFGARIAYSKVEEGILGAKGVSLVSHSLVASLSQPIQRVKDPFTSLGEDTVGT